VATPDYREGFDDGLRFALEIMRGLEAGVLERMALGSASRVTDAARKVRAQAYRSAGQRIATRINRRQGGQTAAAVARRLDRIGL